MIARMRLRLSRLGTDQRGTTIIEFAMVAPVMCLLLLGAFDFSHTLYLRGVLQGVVQKTARDATIETGNSAVTQQTLDDRLRTQVSVLFNNADIAISRRYYRSFAEAAAARAETFTDTNKNGRCDNKEPYEDANRNSVWDADGGNEGQGGAKDATVYTVTVTYTKLMPLSKLIGGGNTTKLEAETVLRNQPYGDQGSYGTAVLRNCT
jgi:Flp pilus assembly protein TadG